MGFVAAMANQVVVLEVELSQLGDVVVCGPSPGLAMTDQGVVVEVNGSGAGGLVFEGIGDDVVGTGLFNQDTVVDSSMCFEVCTVKYSLLASTDAEAVHCRRC